LEFLGIETKSISRIPEQVPNSFSHENEPEGGETPQAPQRANKPPSLRPSESGGGVVSGGGGSSSVSSYGAASSSTGGPGQGQGRISPSQSLTNGSNQTSVPRPSTQPEPGTQTIGSKSANNADCKLTPHFLSFILLSLAFCLPFVSRDSSDVSRSSYH
jgi:hypothetical protein